MFKSDVNLIDDEAAFLRVKPGKTKRTGYIIELMDSKITTVNLRRMLEEGMNVCAIQSGFFSEVEIKQVIRKLHKATNVVANKVGVFEWPTMLVCSLKSLQVKTGLLVEGKDFIYFKENEEVILTNDPKYWDQCNHNIVYVDNNQMTKEVKVGMEITIDEGEIVLECLEIIDKKSIKAIVTKQGNLSHIKPVCFRGSKCLRPYFTDSDYQTLRFCVENSLDGIIIYYASNADSIQRLMSSIDSSEKKPFVFAAICNEEGLRNIDEIIEECDAILLCRAYLEYELPKTTQYRMLAIQKYVVGKCIAAGVPIFISGGVFTYLTNSGILLHSEISDVKNSVLNGVSGFALKGGPDANLLIKALEFLKDLCCNLEEHYDRCIFRTVIEQTQVPLNAADAAMVACVTIAFQVDARLIIIPTVTGKTAKALSCFFPSCYVVVVCTSSRVARMLSAYRDIYAVKYTASQNGKKFNEVILHRIEFGLGFALKKRWIFEDEAYVTLQRSSDTSSYCDMIRIWNESTKDENICPETGEEYP